MNKIITCSGYYGTGSSVITDFLKEFDNCYSMGDYEFRFIQDPDGISDLDYNLVENNHRHNSGNALKKYEKLVKFLSGNFLIEKYERYFNKQFKKESLKYIESLKDLEWVGMWHEDVRNKGALFYYVERFLNKIVNISGRYLFNKKEIGFTLLKKEKTYYSYPREKFYLETRAYIDKLFSLANKTNKEYIVVDQLVPPSNLKRYNRYFNNIKIIIVDRDPRDCYILEKLYWKGSIIPTKNVRDFIEWYKLVRNHQEYELIPNNVLKISFEELVYNYDSSIDVVIKFLKLKKKNHCSPKSSFNPEISIKNTQLWKRHRELKEDIELIEKELKEFCYSYK